ncbi:hypothetical protein [Tuberibacillus sp. Marseille-P3662]|uniref:hypothetical protein n=1 Tax=Tuberibacillus sp. Marseille-P3662 TaxID=1965358 RepID=UPI000A1C91F4|nr:hypothetical protein [Tuberibacillus sp. Marseille-P3662]
MATSIKIPASSDDQVNVLMGHMGIEHRPTVLRIALSKGVFHFDSEPPEAEDNSNGREIPLPTLCPDNHLVIIKHCLIQKLNKNFDDNSEFNKTIRKCLVYGIDLMIKELSTIDDLDNYLLFLVDNLGNKNTINEDTDKIKELLGL